MSKWLGRFYCISGIILTPKEIGPNDSLSPTKNSESILNTVKNICGDIIANPNKWTLIMQLSPDEITVRANNFIKMHERTAQRQKQIQAQELISQPIDDKKVLDFKGKVTTAWQNSSSLRYLITKIGNYSDKSIVSEVPLLGLQNLVPKNEFVKNPQAMVCGIENFGQAMGRGENSRVLSVFLSNGTNFNITEEELLAKITEVNAEMETKNINVNAILTGSRKLIRMFQKSELYQPYWSIKGSTYEKLHGYEGNLGALPVFFVHELENEAICLVDMKKIGTFCQYKVEESDTEALNIRIQVIDSEKAKELIKTNPKLGQNEKGDTLPESEAVDKLRQLVLVRIAERMDFEIVHKDSCSVLKIQPTVNPS
jgi:hypothetical protein